LKKKGIAYIKKFFAYISPICREAPLERICIKFCMTGPLANAINRAKFFYLNQVRGFDSVGSKFWIFHRKQKSPLTRGLNYRSACDYYPHARFTWNPVYSASGKNILDIFDCILKKNYQILIIFDKNIFDTTSHQIII